MRTIESDRPKFRFAVFADPHSSQPLAPPHTGAYGDQFIQYLRLADQHPDGPPDFALVLGDIHLQEIEPRMAEVPFRLYPIAGNHEDAAARRRLRAVFAHDFLVEGEAADYYAFTHKGVRFVGICNARDDGDHTGYLSGSGIRPHGQHDWLERELAGSTPCKIVFGHVPPQPNGFTQPMHMNPDDSFFLSKLMQCHVPALAFFGHQHRVTRCHWIGGTPNYTVRSCAWNFDDVPAGYLDVLVDGEFITVTEVFPNCGEVELATFSWTGPAVVDMGERYEEDLACSSR